MQQESPSGAYGARDETVASRAVWTPPTFETTSLTEVTRNSEFVISADGLTAHS